MKEEGPNEFIITLQATATGAWDGKTQTEPQTDENGVYQIGTGAELAWFVAKSKDADVTGVLTANINLGKYAWLNISSSKKVTLDGAGFEITGLNATAGLFAQIGSNSYIHDLTIRGAVSGKGNAGAIAGYASGTAPKIANCFNYAVITSTGNNVGGLVGYTYQNAVIENCANFGAVTGGSSVGGIIGGTVSNGSTITGCYNTAEISATGSKAGGIIGGTSSEMTVTSCYNTGKISGTASGGIAGEVKGNVNWSGTVQGKITISSCYSTGEAGSAVFGTVDTASSEISKCYYLNTLNADANAEALNEADLKDADLSDAFGPVCGGYPALRWQTDVTFHEANGEGTVVDPLCTVKGYTRFTCSECGESYRTAYVAALGHDFCEDLDGSDNSCVLTAPTCTQPGKIVRTCRRDGCSETKEDIVPAKGHTPKDGTEQVFTGYKTYECAVCGETYTVWDDDRLGHVSYPEQTVTSISVSDNGNYPWVYNADLDRFESSNQEQDKTSSTTSFAFTLSAPTVLRFGYGVSSENGYDKLTITLAADGGSTETLADAVSGEKSGSIKKQLAAGSYTLTLSYVKDDASKGGSDMAYVSVLTLAGMARVIVENTTFPKAEGAVWEGTLADTWIELTGESTMMGCVVEALDGHTVVGAESNYISSIDNLKAFDGGTMSGWMGTLNDWFTNFGFGEFTVAKGTLCAGDEIRIMYTRTVEDLGGSWNNSDTRLKALTFSTGKLAPKFSGDTFTYTLTVPEGTTSLLVTPTAANKNYQVRAYLGTQATGREYSRTSLIPIANGSVITVVCADDSWPTMNKTSDGKRTYTINVVYGEVKSDDAGVTSVKVAGVSAAAGTAENSFSVTLPAGTEVTADSFEITLSDSKATLTGPAKGEDGVWTFTVTAEDGTAVTYSVTVTVKEAKTIHATISMQAENMFIMVPTRVEVSSDLAERYGYADDVTDGVSALDVLVKYHELTFGEDFTKDSKSDYLVVSNGTITTVNGEKTSAFSFAVNGEFPCDKNGEYNTQYGYTGYTISQTPVAEDGTVEFFFYQDTSMYMDYYTWFTDTDGNRLDTFTVQAGTDFTLGMDGYMYAYGGGLKPEDRVTHGAALDPEDIQICTVGEDGTLTPVEGKTIGEDGQVTLSFAAAGSYVLSAIGDEYTDIVSPWLPVTVTAAPKSSNAGVSSITVAGVEATAGENNTYTVTLPYGTDVTAGSFVIVTSDAGATVGALTNEGNVWTFTVTAEDGVTSKTYTVTVSFTEAPKSNDANVNSVTVAGVEATAGENNTYTVTLPYGTDVTAGSFVIVTSDAGATVGALTNEGNVWTFTVTAEDRVTSKTYTVTVSFTEAPKSNDAGVSSITVAGFKAVAGANNSYTVTVPYGTVVKTGSFVIVTRHPRATVSALTNTRNIWSFTVTAEDGVTTAVYTVTVNTAALPEPITPGVDNKKPASKPEVKLPFTDVSTSDWFYDDVAFVYKNGLFSGTDSRSFSPNASMTRAMLVTVLYRLEGDPTVTGRSSFTDVRSGAYYEKSVIWAAANGIVTGTDSTSFSPDAKVTREQLAAILYRYAQYRKLDTDASAKLNSFTDADSVSAYASEALGWAVSEGLINGASGKLMPKGDATRAQVAAILHRFVKNVLN